MSYQLRAKIWESYFKVKSLLPPDKKSIDPVIALEYGACKTNINLPFETKAGINPARFVESHAAS
jgi:hypothetical protein